jgi:hypothetical protein
VVNLFPEQGRRGFATTGLAALLAKMKTATRKNGLS